MVERAFRELMAIIKRHVPLFMSEAPCRRARGHRKLTQESYKAQLIYCSCWHSDNRGNAGEKQDRCFLLFRPRGWGNGCCQPILRFVMGIIVNDLCRMVCTFFCNNISRAISLIIIINKLFKGDLWKRYLFLNLRIKRFKMDANHLSKRSNETLKSISSKLVAKLSA